MIKEFTGFDIEPDDLIIEDVHFTGDENNPQINKSWVSVYDKSILSYDIDFVKDEITLLWDGSITLATLKRRELL